MQQSLVVWRDEMRTRRTLTRDQMDELEDHLVAVYESLLDCRLAPREAWSAAREALGTPEALADEFAKVESRGWLRTVRLGIALFALSFALPAYGYSLDLFGSSGTVETMLGVQAFLFAVSGDGGAIAVLSALTNTVIPLLLWRLPERDRRTVLALGVVMSAAFLLNGWWLTQVDAVSELRIGYFAWLSSFGVMASGLLARARDLAARVGLLTAG